MRDTGKFFPPQWRYAYGDVWVLFLHAFTLPLLTFMPNGYAAHAAVSLFGAALILTAVWQLGAVTGMSRRARWAALALIACGMSPNMAENLFGQQAYGILFWIGATILVAAWKFFHTQGRTRFLWAALALMLVFLAAWGNPQRAVVYMVLPTLFGAAVVSWLSIRDANSGAKVPARRAIALFGALALAASIAGARQQHWALNLNDGMELLVVPAWLSFDGMVHNLLAALRGLISLLGGFPEPGTPVITGAGLRDAARLGAAAVLLTLLPWALWHGLHSKRSGRVYFTAATTASIIISLVVYVTTTVPNSSDPEASIRYVVPGLVGALLLLIQAVSDGAGAPFKRTAGALAALVLASSAPFSYGLAKIGGVGMADQDKANGLMTNVRFLQAQQARYGYASYWNAGNNTVLSDHTVKVRQIVIADGLPRPQRFLSSDAWYEPAAWRGPTFLFLTNAEDALINWASMTKLSGEPQRRIQVGGMVYVEYAHNIARDLPLWSLRATDPMRFPAAADTAHSIGEYDAAAGAMRAAAGAAGALRFGPYGMLAPGRYKVTFELRAEGDGVDDFGHVDVVAEDGKLTLAAAPIVRGGQQSLAVDVDVPRRMHKVEYRIFTNGKGAVSWTNVTVQGEPLPASSQGVTHGR